MKWTPLAHVENMALTPELQEWLSDKGSLTQRLRKLSSEHLQLSLLSAQWEELSPNNCEYLKVEAQQAWCRTVIFSHDNKLWEWAKTVIPHNSLTAETKVLFQWGNQPLGDLLFTDPSLYRSDFEFRRVAEEENFYREISILYSSSVPSSFLMRRSLLYFRQKPLMIYECFLPDLLRKITEICLHA